MILAQADFLGRAGFGAHLASLRLDGPIVEVGVNRGDNVANLAHAGTKAIHLVDSWEVPVMDGSKDRLDDTRFVELRFARDPKVKVVRAPSLEAAVRFDDESLALVYLDADHSYMAVRADIIAWWPKVQRGGLIAGHDFLMHGPDAYLAEGVQRAVMEQFGEVYLVVEPTSQPWSWFARKV